MRTETITFYISDEEKKFLEQAGKKIALNLSEFARMSCFREANQILGGQSSNE